MITQRVYLQEEPEVVLGMESDYAAVVKNVIYPMLGPDSLMRIRPIGAFRNDTAYDPKWTTFTFLWAYEGWDDYARERHSAAAPTRASAQQMTEAYERHSGLTEYIKSAGKYRTRSNERLLVPVDFSPQPEPLPTRTSLNAVVIRQQFTVEKNGGSGFLERIQNAVLPAAQGAGLKLELLARVVGRPRDYVAYWTLPGWPAWAELQKCRRLDSLDNFLPGSERLWDYVADISETALAPFAYSPLGGLPD